jgi:hypothetical protein
MTASLVRAARRRAERAGFLQPPTPFSTPAAALDAVEQWVARWRSRCIEPGALCATINQQSSSLTTAMLGTREFMTSMIPDEPELVAAITSSAPGEAVIVFQPRGRQLLCAPRATIAAAIGGA